MMNKTLTIMFIDLQGYTSLTTKKTRDEQQLFVHEIRSFVEKHVKAKSGQLVKAMGDGFIATFESPTDAISCGKEIQKEISRRNESILNTENLAAFRIGISTGEASIDDGGDVFGDVVNIAARIQKFAEPNEVFISESTYLAMNIAEIKALDLGPQSFKNVLRQVRVYKVLKDDAPAGASIDQGGDEVKKAHAVVLIVVSVVSTVLAVYFGAQYYGLRSRVAEKAQRWQKLMDQRPMMKRQGQDMMQQEQGMRQQRQGQKRMMQPGQGGRMQQGEEAGMQQPGQQGMQNPCGDGVCDPKEQENPNLCPQDCAGRGQ